MTSTGVSARTTDGRVRPGPGASGLDHTAEIFECDADMDVLMGVDADRNSTPAGTSRILISSCLPLRSGQVTTLAGQVDGAVTRLISVRPL